MRNKESMSSSSVDLLHGLTSSDVHQMLISGEVEVEDYLRVMKAEVDESFNARTRRRGSAPSIGKRLLAFS
jgi:hypothetical protein